MQESKDVPHWLQAGSFLKAALAGVFLLTSSATSSPCCHGAQPSPVLTKWHTTLLCKTLALRFHSKQFDICFSQNRSAISRNIIKGKIYCLAHVKEIQATFYMRISSFIREILKFGREETFVVETCLFLLKPT